MTTRGMKEPEATKLAELMLAALNHRDDAAETERVRSEVRELCEAFPVPDSFV
jgi:glycine hydroxymethyltransferase